MSRRARLLSAIAACGVLAGPVSAALASDSTIRATIDADNARIGGDEAGIVRAASAYDRNHRSAPLIAALNREVRDLRALQARLARQSGSTARGRRGKQDVVTGLGLIAAGYAGLARDVRAASAHMPVTAGEVRAARAADRRGHNRVVAGLKLLSK